MDWGTIHSIKHVKWSKFPQIKITVFIHPPSVTFTPPHPPLWKNHHTTVFNSFAWDQHTIIGSHNVQPKKPSYFIQENETLSKKKKISITPTVPNDYFPNSNLLKIICLNSYTCCNAVLECWERSSTKGHCKE